MKKTLYKHLKTSVIITISAIIAAININVFVYTGNFFPGGFSGISVLINRLGIQYWDVYIPYGIIYIILNIIPTLLVFKYIGKRFTLYSILHFTLVSIFTDRKSVV